MKSPLWWFQRTCRGMTFSNPRGKRLTQTSSYWWLFRNVLTRNTMSAVKNTAVVTFWLLFSLHPLLWTSCTMNWELRAKRTVLSWPNAMPRLHYLTRFIIELGIAVESYLSQCSEWHPLLKIIIFMVQLWMWINALCNEFH